MTADAVSGKSRAARRTASNLKRHLRSGISWVVRNRAFHVRRRALASRKYLDIGCGYSPHREYINLDYNWHRGVDICWDLDRGIPLADASVKGIFTEHCLEHLSLATGDHTLAECYRVLEPGGTLRIIVPDGELYLTTYANVLAADTSVEMPFAERDEYRGMYTPIMSVNRIFSEFGHRFIYDYETLRALLVRHGFVDVERSAFGKSRDPVLLIDTARRAPESLYVEATRPGD